MTHLPKTPEARAAEDHARQAMFDLGRAIRLQTTKVLDEVIHDVAMYQADRLIQAHGFPEAGRASLERSLRLLAQQGLAVEMPAGPLADRVPATKVAVDAAS